MLARLQILPQSQGPGQAQIDSLPTGERGVCTHLYELGLIGALLLFAVSTLMSAKVTTVGCSLWCLITGDGVETYGGGSQKYSTRV